MSRVSTFGTTVSRCLSSYRNIDYYAILGLDQNADVKAIKTAYYKLSKAYHPDRNPNDKDNAAQKFHEVSEAYEVLGSDEKRKLYDMTRIRASTDSAPRGTAMRRPAKQYTDVDIDYKSFEHFQASNRRRRQFHSHFDFPDEFYAEFGGKKRTFKSEYHEATEEASSAYKDSRTRQREEEELRREIIREQELQQKKYPIPTFEQLMREKRAKEATEQRKYVAGLLGVSSLAFALFVAWR